MQIVRLEKINEMTGETEIAMVLSKDQTQVLIEYAISSLLQMGLVSFVDKMQEDEKALSEMSIGGIAIPKGPAN
jgi:mannitol/fructose-specific phosphotransferase system IIA component